jgi:DNA polymerase-3 subunit beta
MCLCFKYLKEVEMKFQTTKNDFLNAVLTANKAIGLRASSFILGGVMLDLQESLIVYSTDLETSIKCEAKVKALEKGKTVVPSKILINILKSLEESKVELELDKETNRVKITCGEALFSLNTMSIEEYPDFPEIKRENPLKIELKKFKNLLSKVQKAASLDESRGVLTGVLMEMEGGLMSMAATDSYRLALIKEKLSAGSQNIKVVIPTKVLDSIIKSEHDKGDVEIYLEENQISFCLAGGKEGENIIVSRLLSGKFPEYKQLIPKSLKHNIVVDKEKMLEVVKRISSISQDNIPIKLTFDKGKATVSMDIKEVGSSSEDFDVSYGEERIEIAFNPEFLLDGINIMDDRSIILSIEEPLKPIIITSEKNKELIYLLMPVRVSQQ